MGKDKLAEVLDRVGHRVRRGVLPVVVFDLDSTLFSTRARNLRILRDFADDHGADYPGLVDVAAAMREEELGWGITGDARARGLEDPAALDHLGRYWMQRFFTSEYVLHDKPTPGAVEYVSRVHELGALVYYLTGRHVSDMGAGTVKALTDAGFPLWRGRVALHLKPAFDDDDREFKDDALTDIRSHHGDVVATFENEPENANLFVSAFPDALNFLLQTVHSPRPIEPVAELVKVPDFRLD